MGKLLIPEEIDDSVESFDRVIAAKEALHEQERCVLHVYFCLLVLCYVLFTSSFIWYIAGTVVRYARTHG